MIIDEAFDAYQDEVNADPAQVRLARERRDLFKKAFRGESDVLEVFGSGSLARSTQLKPVHDVDLIVVFDKGQHPDWGEPGSSSERALRHVQDRTIALLGAGGSVEPIVRETRVAGRDRAVKCFIDPPDAADAFTVDVMPVFRNDDKTLLVPSMRSRVWSIAAPEYLIDQVAQKQRSWQYFRPMVRVLKDWRLDLPFKVKSLVLEVLALTCLPTSGNRSTALQKFFTAAAVEANYGVKDPAGYCGDIQPDLDLEALSNALSDAGITATAACTAAADGDTDGALRLWRSLFGDDFPAPDKPARRPAVAPALIRPRPVKDAPQG